MKLTKESLHYIYAENNKSNMERLSKLCDHFGISCLPNQGFYYIEIYSADNGVDDEFELLDTDHPDSSSKLVNSDDIDDMLLSAGLKQKPKRTKVEYVKVTDSIFHLQPDLEAGELFTKIGDNYSQLSGCEGGFASSFLADSLYRRVEVEIDWRDEVESWQHKNKVGIYTPLDFSVHNLIHDHEAKFIKMCHLVAELTDKPKGD